MNLLKNVKITYGHALVAAANNTDVESDIVDMSGYDGVLCILPITSTLNTGTVTLTGRGAATNVHGAAYSGAVATVTDAGGAQYTGHCLVVDIYRPIHRFVDFRIQTGVANGAVDAAIIIQYKGRKAPIAQAAAEVGASTQVISPALA